MRSCTLAATFTTRVPCWSVYRLCAQLEPPNDACRAVRSCQATSSELEETLGTLVGDTLGVLVGDTLGVLVGDTLGVLVGDTLGVLVGDASCVLVLFETLDELLEL